MRLLIFIMLTLINAMAYSDEPKTIVYTCLSVTNPNSEIHLKVANHKLEAVSFVKGNWSQQGGPYFDVMYSESGSGELYARYNKTDNENAFIAVERKLLNGSSQSGVAVSDEIPYKCHLKN